MTGADINIEDDGRVFVGSREGEGAEKAIDMIEQIVNPRLPEVGERFEGTVVKTTDFGAFVSLTPVRDGLLHISKLGRGKRLSSVEEAVKTGDKIMVEIESIERRARATSRSSPSARAGTRRKAAGRRSRATTVATAVRRATATVTAVRATATAVAAGAARVAGTGQRLVSPAKPNRGEPSSRGPSTRRVCASSPSACPRCARWRSASG